MISLYLLAAHLAGDFPLQPDWMAEQKLESVPVRALHVGTYSLPFLPLVWLLGPVSGGTFVLANAGIHFVVDSRRWSEPKESWEPPELWVWLIDQIIHLATMAVLGVALFGI